MSRRGARGTRKFGGRYFLLAGRGTRAAMTREAAAIRARGHYVRVVRWNPFLSTALAKTLDDYAVFTYPREVR